MKEADDKLRRERNSKWPYGIFNPTWEMVGADEESRWYQDNANAIDTIQRAHAIWPGIEWSGFPDKSR